MASFSTNDTSRMRMIQLSSLERTVWGGNHTKHHIYRQAAVTSRPTKSFIIKRSFISALVVLMSLFYPAGIYAQEAETPVDATPTSTVPSETPPTQLPDPTPPPAPETPPPPAAPTPPPPAQPQTGPQKPQGPDAKKYQYNAATGLWENDYYTWDPVTNQTKPKTQQPYSYNPATGQWDTEKHVYNPASGAYEPRKISMTHDPTKPAGYPLSGTDAAGGGTSSHLFDLYYDASISNNINSSAHSGDAAITYNTLGGNAQSGNALTMANVLNLLQSSASLGAAGIKTFNSNVTGDVFGDLFVDPSLLSKLQPSSAQGTADDSVKVNIDANGRIDNNIVLDAQSGNATVDKNTAAGDATTGSAHAVANIVNMINSAIGSGSSFIGNLNIYGNLNGDILLPPGVLDTLLASNTPQASLDTSKIENREVLAEFNDNQAINNNVQANAQSGNATVAQNTVAGNATTGDAETNVTILNLTGRRVVANNSLLVFVNVLGKWVGVIMDAPAGSTSAALASGVTQDSQLPDKLDITSEGNHQINNNVSVNAASGDATVTNNTSAGDAQSGDASASVNLLNVIDSSFNLSDWFGVLFINVFGTWNGSFGVDTEAGETPQASTQQGGAGGSDPSATAQATRVFQFRPTGNGSYRMQSVQLDAATTTAVTETAVQAASTTEQAGEREQTATTAGTTSATPPSSPSVVLPLIGFAVASCLLGVERLTSRRKLA